jgi:hypothetical protein
VKLKIDGFKESAKGSPLEGAGNVLSANPEVPT